MGDEEKLKEEQPAQDVEKTGKEKGNSSFLGGILTGVLFCSLIMLVALFLLKGKFTDGRDREGTELTSTDGEVSMEQIQDKMEVLEQYVNQYYYFDDTVDMNAIAEDVYEAYIAGLDDPYSVYYTPEEMNSMLESISGSYCGIGAVVSQYQNGEVVVVLPYEGTPAAEAGLQSGDIILSIDGTEITGMGLEAAVALVKGEEGTSAVFKIRRDEEEFEVTITRRKIDVPSVSHEMKDGNVGYVYISSFEDNTSEQFQAAIEDLLSQGAEGIVFDLRDNGGGTLDAVTSMLDYILPEELLLYMEDKYDNRQNYYSEASCMDENIPMAVIINGNTASASEVFTGALQDYKRAKVFGTKSFGKGVVQNLIPLSDGSGLKLTIAEYFTPLGRNFNHNGIDPDEVVELPTEEEAYDEQGYLKEEYDTQLNAAVAYVKEQLK